MLSTLGRSHASICLCTARRLPRNVFLMLLISYTVYIGKSIVQVLVLYGSPVGDEQSVGVVACLRHVLYASGGNHGAFDVARASLDELRAVVGELALVLVELYGVAHDGADRRRGHDVGIKSFLVHRLLLLQRRAVGHVHRLAHRPLDIVVVGRQGEKVLVEELDMRLRFHREIRLQLCAFRQEWDVAVEDVYLLTLLADEGEATQRVKPQRATEPTSVARTVNMARCVFCANDCMSIFLFLFGYLFDLS